MTIKPNQVKAARALLGWSQDDLAERAGLSKASIAKFEINEREPHQSSMDGILQAFELSGIVFTKNGVELKDDAVTVIEGDDWYLRLLDDVYYSLKDCKHPELLLICADDRVSSLEVNDSYRKMRSAGVKMRQLVEEDNSYLMGSLNEYRYLPKERFNNYVSLIYGQKVAICTDTNTKAIVFKDPILAKTWTNIFDVMWDVLKQPERSDADERF